MSLHNGVDSSDVCPKRFGLKHDPPSIVLEYLQISTGKLFHRRIGLRKLSKTSDPARVADKLRRRNESLLGEDKVSFEQLVTLVRKLQEATSSGSAGAPASGGGPASGSIGGGGGGTQADDATPRSTSPPTAPAAESPSGIGRPGGIGDADIDYHKVDLNKMTTEELAEHKAKMDGGFLQNQKKPGDAGFVYDVRVDFDAGTADPSGWDDSEEDIDPDGSTGGD